MPVDPLRRGVLCGGSIIIDVNMAVDRYPAEEGIAFIESAVADSGGPGFNMAVNLTRLGAPFPVEIVGVVGDDANGALAREICRRQGIGAAGLSTAPGARTSYTDVFVAREDAKRTFFHDRGANALLTPAHFDLSRTQARILHLGAPGLHDAMDGSGPGGNGWAELLPRARAAGLRTNMELVTLAPERQRELVLPCLPHLDSIVINEMEAAAVAEIDTHQGGAPDFGRAEAAALRILELGVSELAVVHFPEGCAAAGRGGRTWRQGSVKVPPADVRSTNGAGDAFASGVIFGLHEGWPVERCLEAGACVAAMSLGAYSTSGAIRPIEECLAYGRARGFRGTP
jgi:sugar/nucleoside kinase (ribokinase family)